jgi:hypothetical protein
LNTTYFVYFYRNHLKWQFNLRVHAIPNVVNMVDFDSGVVPFAYHNAFNPGGVPIDGFPDPGRNPDPSHWDEAVSPAHGGLVVVRQEPIPVPALQTTSYWWDDSTFADFTGTDEPGRFGCPGFVWIQIANTDIPGSEARACLTLVPTAAGTESAGAEMAEQVTNPIITAVEAQELSSVAVRISTGPVLGLWLWPNPMIGSTSIRYAIPAETTGNLALYAVSGRLLWSHQVTGSGEVVWDGTSGSGERAAPGVYWVRLTADPPAGKLSRTIRFVRLD